MMVESIDADAHTDYCFYYYNYGYAHLHIFIGTFCIRDYLRCVFLALPPKNVCRPGLGVPPTALGLGSRHAECWWFFRSHTALNCRERSRQSPRVAHNPNESCPTL